MQNHKLGEALAACSPECPEEEAGRLREESGLPGALVSAGLGPDNNHLSLAALRRLADERRACAGEWDPPAHLAGCPVCLEAFQVLLEGEPQASLELLRRCEMLLAAAAPMPARARRGGYWRGLKWAAAFLILASTAAFLRWYTGRPPILAQGQAQVAGTAVAIAPGASLSRGQPVMAGKDSTFEFCDGSIMQLQDHTRFAYSKSLLGSETVSLSHGSAAFTIKPRKPAQAFKVTTPIAEITVIGTRFTVTEVMDDVLVFETLAAAARRRVYDTQIARVVVRVEEGTVGVSNRRQSISVPAGQTAVIQRDQPWILMVKNESAQ